MITENYHEVIVERVFASDRDLTAQFAEFVPSDDDINAEVRVQLARRMPYLECGPGNGGRYVIVASRDHKRTQDFERSKAYVKVVIAHEELFHHNRTDLIRQAYLSAARKFGDWVADKAAAAGATRLLWTGRALLQQRSLNGALWMAVDPDMDGAFAILAAYFHLVPDVIP